MTTLFGTTAEPTGLPAIPAAPPKKHGWLPLLTVLFLISYGLMTMLIVEQGQTIQSQRALIRDLFRDSNALSAARMRAHEERAQAPVAQTPSTRTPSNRTTANQAPAKQSPSSQAAPQHRAQNQMAQPKTQFRMPSKPASDLSDSRRNLKTI